MNVALCSCQGKNAYKSNSRSPDCPTSHHLLHGQHFIFLLRTSSPYRSYLNE
jgi:hypothetical protein